MIVNLSVSKDNTSLSVDLIDGTAHELHAIVQTNLLPAVRNARSTLDKAVKQTALRLKLWAIEHMQIAQKLGKRTDLFEKLINNPDKAAEQLMLRLFVEGNSERATNVKSSPFDKMLSAFSSEL